MKCIRVILLLLGIFSLPASAQLFTDQSSFTRADTLRGMLGPLRSCYDINYYHLDIKVDIHRRSVSGSNEFVFTATRNFRELQFDLSSDLKIDKILYGTRELYYTREFNAVFVNFPEEIKKGDKERFTVFYSGKPVIAELPPWSGGFIFTKDKSGNPWVSVACQGIGASCWWPNKDHQSDEPDSMLISISVPGNLQEISNGRLISVLKKPDDYTQYNWFVNNPINNYDVTFYIGKYAHWTDSYKGESGNLNLNFWSLKEDSTRARQHWDADVKPMLQCFEYWFGPYPFYKDGYKLVQAPFLGMEHQTAIAYGNKFKQGYLDKDLSGTGYGLKWDYIIVHESGHEWFGNSITSKDIADMWIHEGFANYSEALFTECTESKQAGNEYVIGLRKNIINNAPVIGPYNVNKEGSGDMYYKGANLIHTIRQLINDDVKFRQILRGLNKTFYHRTVTTADIENYISKQSGQNLTKVFDQYLRYKTIPTLEYKISDHILFYRWVSEVQQFNMPVRVTLKAGVYGLISPTTNWQQLKIDDSVTVHNFHTDPGFYVELKNTK